jgi:hypothetical protein
MKAKWQIDVEHLGNKKAHSHVNMTRFGDDWLCHNRGSTSFFLRRSPIANSSLQAVSQPSLQSHHPNYTH